MIFLAIVIVLALLQVWRSGERLQQDVWFDHWVGFLSFLSRPSKPWRLLVGVGLPVLLIMWIDQLLQNRLLGVLVLIFYVGVLFYSLGRGDYNGAITAYLDRWREGNFESAYERATAIGDFKQTEQINDDMSLHEHTRAAILYEGFERWFAVVFWFLLLGPTGALGYRLSYISARAEIFTSSEQGFAMRLMYYLDWVPARLLALSFALTGNFVHCLRCGQSLLLGEMSASELLDRCACAALDGDTTTHFSKEQQGIEYGVEEIQAIQALLSRSVICWLIVIAFLQIIWL